MKVRVVIQAMRPSFLVLTPVCIFLGLSLTLKINTEINYHDFYLLLIAAIFAHISVNTLNEYADFKSGLDFKTEKTAFSGGSGALPNNPEMANTVLLLGLFALLFTVIVGVYFVFRQGIQILPIGFIGVILITTYTKWLNRSPVLCLIAPGLGFGILMVVGTYLILNNEHLLLPWIISLIPFLLINNLLLLNQYPDVKADKSIGRNTFPIAFGFKKSNAVYAIFMLTAYSLIIIYIWLGYLPLLSYIAVIPLLLSLVSLYGANKYLSKIGSHPKYLATNVASTILTPTLLGVSLLYS